MRILVMMTLIGATLGEERIFPFMRKELKLALIGQTMLGKKVGIMEV